MELFTRFICDAQTLLFKVNFCASWFFFLTSSLPCQVCSSKSTWSKIRNGADWQLAFGGKILSRMTVLDLVLTNIRSIFEYIPCLNHVLALQFTQIHVWFASKILFQQKHCGRPRLSCQDRIECNRRRIAVAQLILATSGWTSSASYLLSSAAEFTVSLLKVVRNFSPVKAQ